jgi:3-deoxy-manno-octulosonate cytidylyltransferase (CMP-KDO synthetase)
MKITQEYHFAGIIPARFASTRFPGKPLAMIGDKTMIQRVWEQSRKSLDQVYVATDDERIFNAVTEFGGVAIMTSGTHKSGTDRCAEAAEIIVSETDEKIDIVINIQGDEPFIRPEQINSLKSCFSDKDVQIATLVRNVKMGEDIFNPNHPKVILDSEKNAIYFSRSVIPYVRGSEPSDWVNKFSYLKHIGLYAYRIETLKKLTRLKESLLEQAESLEQNRWLENGFRIRTSVTEWESIGIDTPEDIEKARILLDNIKN